MTTETPINLIKRSYTPRGRFGSKLASASIARISISFEPVCEHYVPLGVIQKGSEAKLPELGQHSTP